MYGEQEGKCKGCKDHFKLVHLEIDHITPKSMGGGDNKDNLQLLCGYCNRIKGQAKNGIPYCRLGKEITRQGRQFGGLGSGEKCLSLKKLAIYN